MAHATRMAEWGFTLLEALVATSLGTILLALVMSSVLSLSYSSASAVAYRDMHANIRHALDVMSRDVADAAGVAACTPASSITLSVVTAVGTNAQQYYLSGQSLHRALGASDYVLASGIAGVGFTFRTGTGAATTNIGQADTVEIALTATSRVVRYAYSDVLRTCVQMRNK